MRSKIAPELGKLAVKILGAVVQSATCERLFSMFLWFHSKRRNRLSAKKVFYSVQAKRSIQRKNEKEEFDELHRRGLNPEDVQTSKPVRLVKPDERTKVPNVQYAEIVVADEEPVLPDRDDTDSVSV